VELHDRVAREEFKRSGKISVDGNKFISAERVQGLLWDKPRPEARFDKRALYDKIHQRIYQPLADQHVDFTPPTLGESVKNLFTGWRKSDNPGAHPFFEFLQLNWQRLVPLAVVFIILLFSLLMLPTRV
jgi:hypothetical protein